jgi:transcriptional regulator with GAF, ATPase, and Fis domain
VTFTNEVRPANGQFFLEDKNGSEIEPPSDLVENCEVAVGVKATANGSLESATRMDAVKVLALALNAALGTSGPQPGELPRQRLMTAGVAVSFRNEVQRFEAMLIRSALTYTGGRQRRAARLLGINVSTMNSKIKRYKITLEELNT